MSLKTHDIRPAEAALDGAVRAWHRLHRLQQIRRARAALAWRWTELRPRQDRLRAHDRTGLRTGFGTPFYDASITRSSIKDANTSRRDAADRQQVETAIELGAREAAGGGSRPSDGGARGRQDGRRLRGLGANWRRARQRLPGAAPRGGPPGPRRQSRRRRRPRRPRPRDLADPGGAARSEQEHRETWPRSRR